jgi:hypothetical protein
MAGESLKITGGNAAGQTITMEQELVIGRSTPGLGSLGGDSEISRVHARIFHDPSGRLTIEDLGSTNGTFVNGNRISGQQPLNSGDQVRVGQTSLSVEGGAADAGATSVGNVIPVPVPPAAPAAAQPPPPTQQLPPQQPYGQPPGPPPPPGPGGPGYAGGPIGGPPQAAGSGGTNRNLIIALAAVLVIALVVAGLAIGGVFGGDDNKSDTVAQTTPTTTTPTTSTASTTPTTPSVAMPEPPTTNTDTQGGGGGGSGGYPPGFAKGFVDSCSSSGKLSHSQCQCWFNKLKANYSFAELTNVLQQAKNGSIPPKAVNLLRQCIQ